MDQTIG